MGRFKISSQFVNKHFTISQLDVSANNRTDTPTCWTGTNRLLNTVFRNRRTLKTTTMYPIWENPRKKLTNIRCTCPWWLVHWRFVITFDSQYTSIHTSTLTQIQPFSPFRCIQSWNHHRSIKTCTLNCKQWNFRMAAYLIHIPKSYVQYWIGRHRHDCRHFYQPNSTLTFSTELN